MPRVSKHAYWKHRTIPESTLEALDGTLEPQHADHPSRSRTQAANAGSASILHLPCQSMAQSNMCSTRDRKAHHHTRHLSLQNLTIRSVEASNRQIQTKKAQTAHPGPKPHILNPKPYRSLMDPFKRNPYRSLSPTSRYMVGCILAACLGLTDFQVIGHHDK